MIKLIKRGALTHTRQNCDMKEVDNMRKNIWVLLLVAIFISAVWGCGGEAAKPNQPNNKITQNKGTAPVTPQPNTERVMADRLANIATQVEGVKAATVVVNRNANDMGNNNDTLGNGNNANNTTTNNNYTAMVGIELNSDIKGTASDNVKKQVADKIKASEKNVSKVLVTTDPNLITRLKDIASGVINGRPISSFATEIEELARRIAPTMK